MCGLITTLMPVGRVKLRDAANAIGAVAVIHITMCQRRT